MGCITRAHEWSITLLDLTPIQLVDSQPHKPPENVALVIRQSLSKVVFAAVTFILRLWRWTDSLWLQMARLPKLVARPTPAPAAAVAVPVPTPARPPPLRAPTSHHPACGIADPAVLHMLQKLHDPTTTHDDRVAHVQQAVGMDSTRTLFSATSRHSLQVEKMRAERGVPEPSGAQLWSVEGTKDVLEEEGALRDALFEKIYEQLASDECRREQGL